MNVVLQATVLRLLSHDRRVISSDDSKINPICCEMAVLFRSVAMPLSSFLVLKEPFIIYLA